jgi:hypothetical protein
MAKNYAILWDGMGILLADFFGKKHSGFL